jgi:hypothetical protein
VAVDWVTISSLATAGGTLILAGATFASVRSANRSATVTERALLAGIRPVLVPTRMTDPVEKVGFVDGRWFEVEGQRAVVEVTADAIYLSFTVRNAGAGIAVLDRWDLYPERQTGVESSYRDLATFTRLGRDIYIPAGDTGFWQGAFRDPSDPRFVAVREAIEERRAMTVDLLYEDHEGGQRAISRFALIPGGDDAWVTAVVRHWNLDRADPR